MDKTHSNRPYTRIHSTGGFWLLIGALLLAASLRFFLWFVVACIIHELGHMAAVWLMGGQIGTLRLTAVGAVLQPRRDRIFSYGEEGIIAAAGPAASLILAAGAALWGRQFGGTDACLLTGLSLVLGLFNLIPAQPLDGGRILQALLSCFVGPDAGEEISHKITRLCGVCLAGAGAWLWHLGGSFTLLLCGVWLTVRRRSAP